MKTKSKFLILFIILVSAFSLVSPAKAAQDIYIAQTAGVTPDGSSCANAKAVSFFNTSGNWGGGAGQISAGTTVHLCGTITTALTVRGSGSSGSPITIFFESGAKISLPYCPGNPNACLTMSNRSFIIVDGGVNGIIEAVSNGSGLTTQNGGYGITADQCNSCEFKNLTIQNIYKRTSATDIFDGSTVRGITFSGNNVLFHNNVIHDTGWAIVHSGTNGDTSVNIYNNDIYNIDHGYAVGGSGNAVMSGFHFYNNHIHDYSNWDSAACNFHHDGIHAFSGPIAGAVPTITDFQIYNNLFDGNVGSCPTAHIFLEGGDPAVSGRTPWTDYSGNVKIFNNIFISNVAMTGIVQVTKGVGNEIYNNTIIGPDSSNGLILLVSDTSGAKVKNNVLSGGNVLIGWSGINPPDLDYNLYANCTSYNCWSLFGTQTASYTVWRNNNPTADVHSVNSITTNGGMNSAGLPQSGSVALSAGLNLSSLNITALNSDKSGTARPSSGAWDIGAYQVSGGGSSPTPTPVTPTPTPVTPTPTPVTPTPVTPTPTPSTLNPTPSPSPQAGSGSTTTPSITISLINASGTFYLITNGIRQGITNPGMLTSYGFSFSDARVASSQDLILPQGPLLTPGDGSLVKSKEDQTVYLISNQKRYGFTSASVFLGLGFKFTSVLVVTDPEMQSLPRSANLDNSSSSHFPGLDINKTGTVYWLGQDNQLHAYPSITVYNSWHVVNDFSRIVPANAADLSIPVGGMVGNRVKN